MHSFAENRGVRIAFEVHGHGEPLVLISGFSQARRVWHDAGHVDALVALGRKLILVDPRGHGDSDKPHDPAAYTPEAEARDVGAVLDALSINRADLLGYSRGGATAIATAIDDPGRCGTIFVGGAHPFAQDMCAYRESVADGLHRWISTVEAHVGILPRDARAMFMANDLAALQAAVAADQSDRSDALARSGVRIILYAGSEDPAAALARAFAATNHARFVELPGINHMQAFFAVDAVTQLVADAARHERPPFAERETCTRIA